MLQRTKKSLLTAGVLMVVLALVLGGCDNFFGSDDGGSSEAEKNPVTIAYVEWARAAAITHVAEEILEDNGYDVTLESKSSADMWESVAEGTADGMLAAWLPETHGEFYGTSGKYTDQIVDAGINYENASIGLVVPSYVSVDSMNNLDNQGAQFGNGNEIQGIDSGAGVMETTQEAINNNTYSLQGWTLIEGSGSEMTTALGNAIDNNEHIVVTGWKPHWKFGKWDLKLLEDPENVYGEPDDIHTMVREGLEADNPGAYQFFDQFDWTQLDVQNVMVDIHEGAPPAEAARDFVDANQNQIDELLPNTEYFQ